MAQWTDIPWDKPLFANASEAIISSRLVALENAYTNEAGGHSRVPGLAWFARFDARQVFLTTWRDNLIAVTDTGRFLRVARDGTFEDVTGVPLSGGGRPVFAGTEDELVVAAGGPIIRLASDRSDVLSTNAPDSTHVVFIDGYLVAIEPFSGRFWYSEPGQYRRWLDLSVFTAEGKPDDLVAAAVTPFRELLLAGPDSIEQFERLVSADRPFYRRYTTGEGLLAPYTLLTDTAGTYGLNLRREFVRFNAQVSRPAGDDVGLLLERVDDWSGAWTAQIGIKGQKLILLQAPEATNAYGTKGVTALLDYRARHWSLLYGWDEEEALPARWPGWSYAAAWGRHFVGVAGGIAEMRSDAYTLLGAPMRMLARTGHIDRAGPSRVDGFRFRVKRGVGDYTGPRPRIGLRVNRDNRGFGRWIWKDLGRPGELDMIIEFGPMGCARTWQFEYAVTDDVEVEFVSASALVERLSW